MNIELSTYEAETLEYILDKFIFQQQQRDLDYTLYQHIKNRIKIQRENHTERILDELRAQIKRGETPSTGALQRQESIGYGRVIHLIEQAKAGVEHERRLAEAIKEQK